MPTIERQITINAPPEKVFSYVAEFTRHSEWARHPLKVEATSQGPLAVGSTFASVGHQMGEHHGRITVTEFTPNSNLVFEAEDDTGRFRHYFKVQGEDGGTRLTKGAEGLEVRPLLFKLIGPIATAFLVPRLLEGDLKRIKARLEEGSGQP